jgi:hypothetical protein
MEDFFQPPAACLRKWRVQAGIVRFQEENQHKMTAPPGDSALAYDRRILKAALLVLKNGCFENSLTFFGNDRILHAFADAEFERRFGRYLNRLARSRVTAFARFAFRQDELAETR